MSKKFDGTRASLTDIYRIRQLRKMEKWVPTQDDLDRLKGKYRLWKKLHSGETNCNHCIFNNHHCSWASNHFPFLVDESWGALGASCHAFLVEGNYITDYPSKATWTNEWVKHV